MNIRASINNGLSAELKEAFPNSIPVTRPLVVNQEIKDPQWLAGFASGDGSFYIGVAKSSGYNIGAQVQLRFVITQHSRDAKLMEGLTEYFDCGGYLAHPTRYAGEFVVRRLSHITEKIIPFFDNYPIKGVKAQDFADFCKVAEIMKVKGHLTESGFEQISVIKAEMNSKR